MKKNKIVAMLAVAASIFSLGTVNGLTKYNYDGWKDGTGYGSKTKVSETITNLKGDETNHSGPFSKLSTAKLEDMITEEAYIEIDPETLSQLELFEVTLGLKNGADEYVSELVVTAQKDGDGVVIYPKVKGDFNAKITEKGIYTYQWKMYTAEEKTYAEFTLLKGEKVISTSGKIDMDSIVTGGTKNPIAAQEDVTVKYLWFCNIQTADGVNVYSELPTVKLTFKDAVTGYTKDLNVVKFTNPTEKNLEDITEDIKAFLEEKGYEFKGLYIDEKFEEEFDAEENLEEDKVIYIDTAKVETEENPETGSLADLFLGIGLISLAGLGFTVTYVKQRKFD